MRYMEFSSFACLSSYATPPLPQTGVHFRAYQSVEVTYLGLIQTSLGRVMKKSEIGKFGEDKKYYFRSVSNV